MAETELKANENNTDAKEDFQECLEAAPEICSDQFSVVPEKGIGELPSLNKVEFIFNRFCSFMPAIASVLLLCIASFITVDVVGRLFFNTPWRGITDLETLFMSVIGFTCLAVAIIQRQSIQIDLFYEMFNDGLKRPLYLMACIISCVITAVLSKAAFDISFEWSNDTSILLIPEWPFIMITSIGLAMAAIAFFFQICHVGKAMISQKEIWKILLVIAICALITALPFIYKASGIKLSGLAIGGVSFLILMSLMLLRVPLGWAMCAIGILGLLAITRRASSVFASVASVPFTSTTTFIMIAFPMFMLMGEMVSLAGLSDDLFRAAKMWLGRLPGGLAVATVGGCAGFGAVCGDSMATVITMSAVALPSMEENKYDISLSCGVLAAGGTLGILIPPSMGFIFYSMVTEESVGKLFIAGVFPGLLLMSIFMLIIIFRVVRNPSLAPRAPVYPLKDKLLSLAGLLPVFFLFLIVVIGILQGWFTPAEGGAIGALLAFLFAAVRRKITVKIFKETMLRCCIMFGKMFAMFVGLYVLGVLLSSSRMPTLLAKAVSQMDVNRYAVLAAVIVLYIIMGCLMNIMPMMTLTLPSIFPTIQALGFDGIWFGVVCVIVMEMGMITPPVGMNVFTLASLRPEVNMAAIFKGVTPFFFGMLLCVLLVIIFPQIALFLVP